MAVQRVQIPISFQYLNASNQLIPVPAGTALTIINRNTGNPAQVFANFTGNTTITSPATDAGGNVPGYVVQGSYAITAAANIAATPPFAGATINWEAVRGDGVENYFAASIGASALAAGSVGTAALVTSVAQAIPPVGSVMEYAGTSAPASWHFCDGSVQTRTGTFAALFGVIGTTYNTGGETGSQFRLPDTRGRFVLGAGNGQTNYTNPSNSGGALSHVHGIGSNRNVTISLGSPGVTVTVPSLGIPDHFHNLSALGGAQFSTMFVDNTHINLTQGALSSVPYTVQHVASNVPDAAWKAFSGSTAGAALYGITGNMTSGQSTAQVSAGGSVNGGQQATGTIDGGQNTVGADPAYLVLNKIIKL